MDQPKPDRSMIVWGLACLMGGIAMILASVGVIPFEPRAGEAPLWVLTLCGSAFALAGLCVALQAIGHASRSTGELPPGAPFWMRAAQSALGLGAAGLVALIGSWVAFGPGERAFSIAGFISGPANEVLGRTVFGFGAVIAWLCVILGAVQALRRLR
jgi:hypothetical protein